MKKPILFTIHDLLHLNHPEIFPRPELEWRTREIATGIGSADLVACPSEWVKADLMKHFPSEEGADRIRAVRWGPPTEFTASDVGSVSLARPATTPPRGLPERFCLYPAATWEHKNHARLFEALAQLRRNDGISLHIGCTGPTFPQALQTLKAKARELGIEDLVHFLGWIPASELRALYRRCEFVIFPSLHEGAGLPILEAGLDGAPVACSNVTALPEYAGDAALFFDPHSPSDMANAIKRMFSESGLRDELRRRGRERLKEFSWESAARNYRALYRTLAGCRNPQVEQVPFPAIVPGIETFYLSKESP